MIVIICPYVYGYWKMWTSKPGYTNKKNVYISFISQYYKVVKFVEIW